MIEADEEEIEVPDHYEEYRVAGHSCIELPDGSITLYMQGEQFTFTEGGVEAVEEFVADYIN